MRDQPSPFSDDHRVTAEWIADLRSKAIPDSRETSHDRSPNQQQFEVDLRSKTYISLPDLSLLYLLVDELHERFDEVRLLTRLDPQNPLPQPEVMDSGGISAVQSYIFLAFLHYFGLFDALGEHRAAERVVVPGYNRELLDRIPFYSGVKKSSSSRVMGIEPVSSDANVNRFRSKIAISDWIANLPSESRESPLFADGEFSSVLGYQLALNIQQHSCAPQKRSTSTQGIIMMRVLKPDLDPQEISSAVGSIARPLFTDNQRGVMEICVADRGIGIEETLRNSFESLLRQVGIQETPETVDVLRFAFDELGTSKEPYERIGGVHALHRILKIVAKYRGLLEVQSSTHSLLYDATTVQSLQRGRYNFGFRESVGGKRQTYPIGTQFHILLPLRVQKRHVTVMAPRVSTPPRDRGRARFVSARAYYDNDQQLDPTEENLRKRLATLANSLLQEPTDRLIAFDLSGSDWQEETIAHFLYSQKAVLHTHTCVAVNLSPQLARLLRSRELLDPGESTEDRGQRVPGFFWTLSSKHRLLPVLDKDGDLHWFGLGCHEFERPLDALISDPDRAYIPFDTLLAMLLIPNESDYESMQVYLSYNSHLFQSKADLQHDSYKRITSEGAESVREDTTVKWRCHITKGDLAELSQKGVTRTLSNAMRMSDCIRGEIGGRDLYSLPASGDFTDVLIQTATLLQYDDTIADEIGAWLARGLRTIVKNIPRELVLVSDSAPSELLSHAIRRHLVEANCRILNHGQLLAQNEDRHLDAKQWPPHAVIVLDVNNSGETFRRVWRFLKAKKFNVLGGLEFIKFWDGEPSTRIRCTLEPRTEPGIDDQEPLPVYTLARMNRPETISADVARATRTEDALFFIEPYSLEHFRISTLTGERRKVTPKDKERLQRINDLATADALRTGHWAFGKHHYRVTISIAQLVRDPKLGAGIVNDLVEACRDHRIHMIMAPFDSSIVELLPRVRTALRLRLSHEPPAFFAFSTRYIARRPFHVIPRALRNAIRDAALKMEAGGDGLNLLIIDDSISSGRTLETMLRAIVRVARKAHDESRSENSPIQRIHVYSILDRQGRARRTLLCGVDHVGLGGDGEWAPKKGKPSYAFSIQSWLEIDIPAREGEACDTCRRYDRVQALLESEILPPDLLAVDKLRRIAEDLQPMLVRSPSFEDGERGHLARTVTIGRFSKIRSYALGVFELEHLLHRGYPLGNLLDELHGNLDDLETTDDGRRPSKEDLAWSWKLVQEMLRLILFNWNIAERLGGTSRFPEHWQRLIERNPTVIEDLAFDAGMALAESQSPLASEYLQVLLQILIADLIKSAGSERPEEERQTIATAATLFVMGVHSGMRGRDREERREILEKIGSILEEAESQTSDRLARGLLGNIQTVNKTTPPQKRPFLGHLRNVLQHTIRPARHGHTHLLPTQLARIANPRPDQGIKDVERRTLVEALVQFTCSLETICQTAPGLFLDAARWTEYVIRHAKLLQKVLGATGIGEVRQDVVQGIAGRLRVVFGDQVSSRLFQCLYDLHLPVEEIRTSVAKACSRADIEYSQTVSEKVGDWEILVPRKEDILRLYDNYLSDRNINRARCPSPRAHLEVVPSAPISTEGTCSIRLYTNFNDDAGHDIQGGSGWSELGGLEKRLFDISASVNRDTMTAPDDRDYSLCISIKYPVGLRCREIGVP